MEKPGRKTDTVRASEMTCEEEEPAQKRLQKYLGSGVSYKPDERLGKTATVFKGTFKEEIIVAVKVLKVVGSKEIDISKRALREVRHLAQVNYHPNTVSYRASGEANDVNEIFIATDLCQQNTLYEFVGEIPHGIGYHTSLVHIGSGLSYIHSKRIVHRGIHPGNILMSLDGTCLKIADFGLSKEMDPDRSDVSVTGKLDSVLWQAPETTGGKFSFHSDIYSLGLVYLFILSKGELFKKYEFDSQSEPDVEVKKDEINEHLSKLSVEDSELSRILITKMTLQEDYHDRPTASEVLNNPLFWKKSKRLQFLEDVYNATKNDTPAKFHSISHTTRGWLESLKEQFHSREGGEPGKEQTSIMHCLEEFLDCFHVSQNEPWEKSSHAFEDHGFQTLICDVFHSVELETQNEHLKKGQ